MPIDDERKFTVTKRYRAGPERETSQVPVAAAVDSGDPLVEGLDELRRVLEASGQECAVTESKAREREEAEQARVERDEKFNKLQQMLHRVKELDDQSRQAKAERKLREEESNRLMLEELERFHQGRLDSRAVFEDHLKEREEQRKAIIAALQERSK